MKFIMGLTLSRISRAHWCSTEVGQTTSVPPWTSPGGSATSDPEAQAVAAAGRPAPRLATGCCCCCSRAPEDAQTGMEGSGVRAVAMAEANASASASGVDSRSSMSSLSTPDPLSQSWLCEPEAEACSQKKLLLDRVQNTSCFDHEH